MQIFKSWNYANYSNYVNYAVYANYENETNYANCAINLILQIGQILIPDGCSTVVQLDWTDGIGNPNLGSRFKRNKTVSNET